MYKCECGKEFDSPQAFNGHKGRCREHYLKEKELQQWISEKHICEKCGKIMTEKFGSGRFCNRICANSRVFSDDAKLKKSLANKNRKCYTNGEIIVYLKPGEKIPEGFIRGNFLNSKYDSFEKFQKQYKELPNNKLLYESNLIKLKKT